MSNLRRSLGPRKPSTVARATMDPPLHFIQTLSPMAIRFKGTGGLAV